MVVVSALPRERRKLVEHDIVFRLGDLATAAHYLFRKPRNLPVVEQRMGIRVYEPQAVI